MALSFAMDIRPLFRPRDDACMSDFFDLSQLSEVRMHAADMYERLSDKSMPTDGPWRDENIAKFKQWMDEGMAE